MNVGMARWHADRILSSMMDGRTTKFWCGRGKEKRGHVYFLSLALILQSRRQFGILENMHLVG